MGFTLYCAVARHETRGTNRGSERQSVSHPASGCLGGKDQTQEGRDHKGPTHIEGAHTEGARHTEGATHTMRPTQETHRHSGSKHTEPISPILRFWG